MRNGRDDLRPGETRHDDSQQDRQAAIQIFLFLMNRKTHNHLPREPSIGAGSRPLRRNEFRL